jgi:two-component system, OmpR family, phosphate regulon sensor histidine kinase PhoR
MTGTTHDQTGSAWPVETRARRRQLFEGLTDVCFAMDADLRFTYWNKASEELVGIPEEEVLGKSWHDIFPPTTECVKTAAEAYRRVLLKRTSEGFIISHLGGGRRLFLDVNAYPNKHGVTVIARDITERRRAEEVLQQEKERAQRYLDIVGTMVVAIDADQTVSLINQAGCRLLGYREAQILGKNWFDHFLPEPLREHFRKVFVQLMAGIVEPVEYVENSVLTRSGEERTIAWHNRILKDKRGHITGTISSGDDITERKRAEAALFESEQRVRRLNEHILNMVMVLSHDIRGPLVAIASILKLMLRGAYGKLDQSLANTVQDLLSRCARLLGTAEDYLGKASIVGGSMEMEREVLDLRQDIIDAVLEELADDITRREIVIDNRLGAIPSGSIAISANKTWLKAVYRNLFTNAVKYGGKGCTISFGFEQCESHYRLNVYNSGNPIGEKDRAKIFSRFERLEPSEGPTPDGVGLGLCLCREIIREHGGEIWYEARPDGSNFVFTISREDPDEAL